MRVDAHAQLPPVGEGAQTSRAGGADSCNASCSDCGCSARAVRAGPRQPLRPVERVVLQAPHARSRSRIASTEATAAPSWAIVVNSGLSAATVAVRISIAVGARACRRSGC